MAGDLLPIGRFARLTRLTVKTLHHCDAIGLLRPAHVDPATGYRSYRVDQAGAALAVSLLRRLDVPIPEIGRALADEDAFAEVVATAKVAAERQAARARRITTSLDRLAETGMPGAAPVTTRTEPDRQVLAMTATGHGDTLDRDAEDAITALLSRAESLGIDADAPVTGVYPADLDGDVAFEVCVHGQSDIPPAGLRRQRLDGGRFLTVDHVGPHDSLPLAYHALHEALAAQGRRLRGPLRETYLSVADETGRATRTRVQAPLDRR